MYIFSGHTLLEGLVCSSESTTNNHGVYDRLLKMARLFVFLLYYVLFYGIFFGRILRFIRFLRVSSLCTVFFSPFI